MSELNINDLPHEMVMQVFRFLNAANLKNATLTCKLWKNLVENTCRWSMNLMMESDEEYNGARDTEQKMNFILATNRKFKGIIIFGCRFNKDNQMLAIFQKHGFHVVKLSLCNCHIDNLIAFAELLNLTPNLKIVNIDLMHVHDVSDVPHHVLPGLKKLKNLKMCVTDYRFVQCFRKAKLTTIDIFEDSDSEHRSTLAQFFLSQGMLTSITAESVAGSSSVLAEMGKLTVPIPFQLKQLAISYMNGRNALQDRNLLRFVKSQTNNLAEMELGIGLPNSVYECVFASGTKLKSLGVVLSHIPRDNDFYELLRENVSVCTMKILATDLELSADMQNFGNFLKKLPNIRNLLLSSDGCMNENILVASQHLSKVELLYMHFIDNCIIDDIGCVNFPNLKTLHIGILQMRIDWNEFTKIHSQLVDLTIRVISASNSFFTSDDIDEIASNVDLQSLKLGVGFVADDRFFEIIRIKCPNLKVLDLHKSSVPHGMSYNKQNNLLRLCDNIECSTYSQMCFASHM